MTTSENTIKIIKKLAFLNYFIIIYFLVQTYLPNIGFVNSILTPFMSVLFLFFSLYTTFIMSFLIIGVVAVYFLTYTTIFDDFKKEPQVENFGLTWRTVVSLIEDIIMIYFFNKFGYNYLTILFSLDIIMSILSKMMFRDYMTKMLKLKLAWTYKSSLDA